MLPRSQNSSSLAVLELASSFDSVESSIPTQSLSTINHICIQQSSEKRQHVSMHGYLLIVYPCLTERKSDTKLKIHGGPVNIQCISYKDNQHNYSNIKDNTI